jgi:hypothetical protein
LAAKYFPHYLGLNFLYYCLFRDKEHFPARRWIDTLLVFGTCAAGPGFPGLRLCSAAAGRRFHWRWLDSAPKQGPKSLLRF